MSQQNKTTLQSAINTQLADNTSGDISAADVRDNMINMTDSLLFNSGSQGITGSLAVGVALSTSGNYSVAVGTGSLASGFGSFAHGRFTTASGFYSHAQGNLTSATSLNAHAEGQNTVASGASSHAEGQNTLASNTGAHSEGYVTTASGTFSHSEGFSTVALGNYSHTEGIGTIASGSSQHVQGQYNIATTDDAAFILGNGTDNNNRSNLIFAAGNTVQITGSLDVNGSITGSLQGTASYATTASYVLPTSPSSILVAADGIGTNFTSVVSTTFKTYLIPANTLTTSSVLEVNVGIVKDTGTGAANIYLALSSSIATTTIAYASINTSQTYGPLWRNFAISGSSLISFTPNSSAATDAVTSTLAIVSSSIDTTIDNYIQVNAITLGSSAVARISYCKIIAHR